MYIKKPDRVGGREKDHFCVWPWVWVSSSVSSHKKKTNLWCLWKRPRAWVEASARICLLVCLFVCCFFCGCGSRARKDGRGRYGEGVWWLLMCKCASCWRAVNGEVWRKKGPERRCLSRGCQRHSMSYSWGLPFKAAAPAQLSRDWEKIKLFGSQQ